MKILCCSNAKNFVKNLTKFDASEVHHTKISQFEDGELHLRIENEKILQGEKVLVVQSISGNVNDAIIELLFAMDMVNSLATKEIYLLITYMGYSRQDRVELADEAFSAKIVADLLSRRYVKRLFVVDLHASQTLGFFGVPSINLNTDEFIMEEIRKKYKSDEIVLVSPDTGNVKSIISIANTLDTEYAVAIKYRPMANENKILSIVGHSVENKICIIIDDIVDSAGTLCNVAERLAKQGAKNIIAYITHPVLSSKAMDRINSSYLKELFVGDTIDCRDKIDINSNRVKIFSVADWCVGKVFEYTY
jgi:ribose-phosphate pyrophosphokinase